ncbi:carbohydrate ABC transporter permease [Leadbettera azotonutricia]|nr:carbohydrate ABC transporter permease [Leadbettera azotonutricia]
MNSFRTNNELYTNPLGLPTGLDFSVFVRAWDRGHFSYALRNSIILTVTTVIITVVLSSLAAYPLARMQFKGRGFLYMAIISGQMVSAQIILIPLFVLFRDMHLLGTLGSVMLAVAAGSIPFSTLLFVNAFREIPKEIDDSTEIDGCSRLQYFFRILLPLTMPIFASVIIFQALGVWNEYLLSLTFLSQQRSRTITLELKNFFGAYQSDWPGVFAALTMTVVPVLILYLFLQKYFIKGLTAGAVKG